MELTKGTPVSLNGKLYVVERPARNGGQVYLTKVMPTPHGIPLHLYRDADKLRPIPAGTNVCTCTYCPHLLGVKDCQPNKPKPAELVVCFCSVREGVHMRTEGVACK